MTFRVTYIRYELSDSEESVFKVVRFNAGKKFKTLSAFVEDIKDCGGFYGIIEGEELWINEKYINRINVEKE